MNLSQLAYNLFTGQAKIDKLRNGEILAQAARLQLYAGAQQGTSRPTPAPLSTPEDYKQQYERITLIRAARQMEEDFQFFDGILGDFESFVVGANLRYMPSTGNPDADKVIAAYCEWKFNECDYAEKLDLNKMARLAVRSYKRDGECGFIVVETKDGIKLSAISGDRIGNPLIGANVGPIDYNGITIDEKTGAPVSYQIYRRVFRTNAYVFQKDVPANGFFHYFEPFRFEQYHGVTVFKNSIEHAYDLKQILDSTKLNIKWRSAQLPYVQNEQGRPRGNGYETALVNNSGIPQPMQIQADGVTQTFLKLGEGVMEYPNDFPNQQFANVMEEIKRDIAIGCKIPLEFCYRSQTGGVVQRFYVDKAQHTFDEEKRWLKRTLLTPYKNRTIQKGIQSGELDLNKFGNLATNNLRFNGTWQMARAISVDYGKEADADIKLMDAGVMSQKDYCADNGVDLDQVTQDIYDHTLTIFKLADQIAEQTGQDIAVILPFLVKKFPNPGAGLSAAGDPATEPAPAKAE